MTRRGSRAHDVGASPVAGEDRALLGAASTIRGLLAEAARSEVLTRHRIGLLLCDMRGAPGTYGARCVERLGDELGIAAATLYRYATVAEAWTTKEIEACAARTTRFGQPLSWSHFVALATTTDEVARQALFEECLDECWSVRELAARVDGLLGSSEASADDPVEAALREGIESAHRATVDLSTLATALADRVAAGAAGKEARLAIGAVEQLRRLAEAALEQLEGVGSGGAARQGQRSEPRVRIGAERSEAPEETGGEAARAARMRRRLR